MFMKKKIVLLGATGSIGESTLHVLRRHRDHFELIGISGHQQIEKLATIAHEFQVPHVGIFPRPQKEDFRSFFAPTTQFYHDPSEFSALATLPSADIVIVATVGLNALFPLIAAMRAKKRILLATKEILVVAGHLIMQYAHELSATILPLDSEHNAIFQCLQGESIASVDKIILTASGGPFRHFSEKELLHVTPEQALQHPTWNMGHKITIDSATLANKGMEIIEAARLFQLSSAQMDVLVHPQSIIHSMVQFRDGNIIAQMSPTSMSYPIAYALFFPERYGRAPFIDLVALSSLTFEHPRYEQFPCLTLARQCLENANTGNPCAVFYAANDVAVSAFLSHKINFLDIPKIISDTLETYQGEPSASIDDCIMTVEHARRIAETHIH